MGVLLDTSVIVEIERKNKLVIDIIKSLINKNSDIYISVISLSEILTGCYLRENYEKAMSEAKRILSQFLWVDMDATIAEKTGHFMAYLIKKGKIVEFPDVVIAATSDVKKCDYLLTLNKAHFENLPLNGKAVTPKEMGY